ncbi:MAG: hypothetical protein ACJ71H_13350 [Nitrososphaeraceae archaeon]
MTNIRLAYYLYKKNKDYRHPYSLLACQFYSPSTGDNAAGSPNPMQV